jgi:hypothetical protein
MPKGVWSRDKSSLYFAINSTGKEATRRPASGNAWENCQCAVEFASGKWYAEIAISATTAQIMLGAAVTSLQNDSPYWTGTTGHAYYSANGQKWHNSAGAAYGSSYTNGDNVGIAVDMATGKIWWRKNGTWQNSGDPAAGTGEAYSSVSGTVSLRASSVENANAVKFTLKTLPSELAYSIPSGFSALTNPASVTLTVKDEAGATINSTAFKWAFFEQASPDALAVPIATGTTSTSGSGVLTVSIQETSLTNGATGSLLISTTDGTAGAQCRSWYVPVTVTV